MSAVERRGARPSRNLDFRARRRSPTRPRHPVSRSTWRPDTLREPIYFSFVSKAVLWERGGCRYTPHPHPHPGPSLCPRFLAHMKARPEDLRPSCFLSSRPRPQPPSQARTASTHILAAPRTQTLEVSVNLGQERRRNIVQKESLMAGKTSAIILPCLPLPTPPPSLSTSPAPQPQSPSQPHPGGQQSRGSTVSPHHGLPPAPEEKDEQSGELQPPVCLADTPVDWEQHSGPDASAASPGPASVLSHGSLSDFSRPSSSLFSRSTDLASGRSSVLSAGTGESARDHRACFTPLPPHTAMPSPPASFPPGESSPLPPSASSTAPPAIRQPPLSRSQPRSPHPASGVPLSDRPLSRPGSTEAAESLLADTSVDARLNPSIDSQHGLFPFPSTTWSSCPSPQRTTPHSGSGPNLTPSASESRLDCGHWPVLPPISPVRERCGTAASRSSELSCTESRVFEELEAIAPRSDSCPSLDEPSDLSGRSTPDRELSPSLAVLTVGCESGYLDPLSRVQLLLLDRPEPESPLSPFSLEEQEEEEEEGDRLHLRMQSHAGLTSAGVVRPCTAGSAAERCDSAGKVQENKSDLSDGGSGSPSSWIIDLSPSYNMFRSARSASHSSSRSEEGPTDEEANYPGLGNQVQRPGSLDRSPEEKRRMEERRTKALSMLSKLQDDTPRQSNGSKGRSNFEDFDFLAKYCIFSPEKLAEYRRVFEAEDTDGDGYISCLQVLLALKSIVPPELLSDEEEIYVYRILEMVDFRVTDGLVDLRLFAVISSLAQKIASMDDFMRSLISDMDLRSLEVRLFKAKRLFLFLLEEQQGEAGALQGFISAEQLLLELKAGGIHLEQEAAVRLELQRMPPLDLLDFLAYLPLFMLIHKSVISNPLDDSSHH